MNGEINLFNQVIQSSWRGKYLASVLHDCTERQAFTSCDSSNLQTIISIINSKLNDRNSRYEGLLILKTFLPQCSSEFFSSNASSWASQALKTVESKIEDYEENLGIFSLSYSVLGYVLDAASKFPDVSKQIVPISSKLLSNLTSDVKKTSCDSLKCLQSCMKNFSRQCMSHKDAIEKLLVSLICFKGQEALLEEASNCFQLLPLLYGSGTAKGPALIKAGNTNFTQAWNQILLKVIRTLHMLLNKLFEDVAEVKKFPDTSDSLAIPFEEESHHVLHMESFSIKYVNLCQYLCSMLKNPFSAAKSIPLNDVFGVLCRTLAITCTSLKDRVSSGILALSACLPQMHNSALSVLMAVIASSRLQLLPFGSLIIKLLMQSLKWTASEAEWPSDIIKPYSSVRKSAYKCLSLWMCVSASASSTEEIADELIDTALLDIVPSKRKLKLTTLDLSRRSHGKHKWKKKKVDDVSNSDKSKLFAEDRKCALRDGSANADTCCAALEALTSLLQSVGPFLKPSLHKVIQDTTVSLLVDIQCSSQNPNLKQVEGSESLIMPYQYEAKCRLHLLKLLLALVLEPHNHKWPPPLGFALHIFSYGQYDPNIEVAAFSSTACRIVERIVHPSASALDFPISLSDMMEVKQLDKGKESAKTISVETTDVSTHTDILLVDCTLDEEEDVHPKKKKRVDSRESLKKDKRLYSSFTPEVIDLCDGEKASSQKRSSCSPDANLQNPAFHESDNEGVLLVRRIEKDDGERSFQKANLSGVPITTINSKAVQVNIGYINSINETSGTSDNVDSPHPPLLVLKLPIQSDGPTLIKDFSQQWLANEEDCIEEMSLEKEEDEENMDDSFELKLISEGEEATENKAESANSTDYVDESREVFVVEQEMPNSHSNNDVVPILNDTSKFNGKEGDVLNEGDVVEVIELDKGKTEKTAETESTTAKQKRVVELDDDLSDGEEMVSCFVDASSESE